MSPTDAKSTSLPNALLQRARKLSDEHTKLTETLSTTFDPKSARRMGELASVATALREWETAQASLAELHTLLGSKDKELRELAKDELETTNEQLSDLSHKLSVALTPRDSFAHLPCLIEIEAVQIDDPVGLDRP